MAKLSITLKIAGTTFPFEIENSDEEVYRHAEREVNRLFADSAHHALLPKDRLALSALHLAMENVTLKASRSLGEDLDRLADIDSLIKKHLEEGKTTSNNNVL
jgi:hypothetical protein